MKVFEWSTRLKKLEAKNAQLRKENADMLDFVRDVLEYNLDLLRKRAEMNMMMEAADE